MNFSERARLFIWTALGLSRTMKNIILGNLSIRSIETSR